MNRPSLRNFVPIAIYLVSVASIGVSIFGFGAKANDDAADYHTIISDVRLPVPHYQYPASSYVFSMSIPLG